MGQPHPLPGLNPDTLEQFLSHALRVDTGGCYDTPGGILMDGMNCCVQCRRFLDSLAEGSPMVTFVVVKMEEDSLFDQSSSRSDLAWRSMEKLGQGMWEFLKESIPHLEATQRVDAILINQNNPVLVLLLRDGSKVFMTGKCWDETVTGNDGCEWIHASMYSLAFPVGRGLPVSKIPIQSRWDVDLGSDQKQHMQALELAFAMGAHPRLGAGCLILKFLNSDAMQVLHDLCFRTRWTDVSCEETRNLVGAGELKHSILQWGQNRVVL